jgi:putative oxidoreductase
MNSTQRYVLILSRVLVVVIYLLNGLGIMSQAQAAKELAEHGAPANLVPVLMLGAR